MAYKTQNYIGQGLHILPGNGLSLTPEVQMRTTPGPLDLGGLRQAIISQTATIPLASPTTCNTEIMLTYFAVLL